MNTDFVYNIVIPFIVGGLVGHFYFRIRLHLQRQRFIEKEHYYKFMAAILCTQRLLKLLEWIIKNRYEHDGIGTWINLDERKNHTTSELITKFIRENAGKENKP